jgi:hypothetical protein
MNLTGWAPLFSGLIPKALDAAESFAGSSKLDCLESSIDLQALSLRLALPAALISYFSPYPVATLTLLTLGILFIYTYDSVQGKKSLADKKLAHIALESQGKLKKALIIQSLKDEYGAFSMRSHIQKVRKLAKTHAISRVVVSDEKTFLRSLPPGRFDMVWVRGHGTPDSIEMGKKFKITKNSRPEIFHTLAGKLKPQGKLILECCRVAYADPIKGNIAEHIASYCWDATVYAPLTKISGIFGLEFDKWGCPHFNDGFSFKGRSVTRVIEGPVPRYRRVLEYAAEAAS